MKTRNRNIGLVGWVASLLITILICSSIFAPVVYPPDLWLEDLHAGQRYTMKSDGTNYWAVRFDGKIFHLSTVAEDTVEWSLGNSSDYDKLLFAEGTWDFDGQVDDMNKEYITIEGTEGTIFDIDHKSDSIHGFALESVDGWIFDGFQFRAETVSKGSGGFESGAIWLRDANNITVRNVDFNNVNGYCVRVDSSSTPTYCSGLQIYNNRLRDAGHNFVGGAGINSSLIDGNILFKDGDDLDDEFIWLGARDLSTDIGSFHNTISNNRMEGGSVLINLDEYTTNNSALVSYNTIIGNTFIVPVDDSGRNDPVIYCNSDNNMIVNNIIVNQRIGQTTGCIVLTDDGGGEPRESNIVMGNHITHDTGSGISGWNVAQSGLVLMGNVIRGNTNEGSISFNDAGNINCTVIGNVCGGLISFDDTTNTNEIDHNTDDLDN